MQDLTLRTRIKRLARKTICFSKSIWLHDPVIGLAKVTEHPLPNVYLALGLILNMHQEK
jgi:hypothetical protein